MNQKRVALIALIVSFGSTTLTLRAQQPATTETTQLAVPGPILQMKHEGAVSTMAISSDGKSFASSTVEMKEGKVISMVHLWSFEDGQLKKSWLFADGSVQSIALSPDGKTLAVGSEKSLTLWDKEGQRQTTLGGHTKGVVSLAFSPDGKTLASASLKRLEDKPVSELFLWDLASGTKRELPVQVPERHSFMGIAPALAFSSDGTLLAAPQSHFRAGIWDVASLQLKNSIGDETVLGVITALALSTDKTVLATGHMGHELRLWDAPTGALQSKLLTIKEKWNGMGPSGDVIGLAFNPDGKTMVSAGTNQEGAGGEADLFLWNWPTAKVTQTLLASPANGVKRFAVSANANLFATLESFSSTVKVWRSTQ